MSSSRVSKLPSIRISAPRIPLKTFWCAAYSTQANTNMGEVATNIQKRMENNFAQDPDAGLSMAGVLRSGLRRK